MKNLVHSQHVRHKHSKTQNEKMTKPLKHEKQRMCMSVGNQNQCIYKRQAKDNNKLRNSMTHIKHSQKERQTEKK